MNARTIRELKRLENYNADPILKDESYYRGIIAELEQQYNERKQQHDDNISQNKSGTRLSNEMIRLQNAINKEMLVLVKLIQQNSKNAKKDSQEYFNNIIDISKSEWMKLDDEDNGKNVHIKKHIATKLALATIRDDFHEKAVNRQSPVPPVKGKPVWKF